MSIVLLLEPTVDLILHRRRQIWGRALGHVPLPLEIVHLHQFGNLVISIYINYLQWRLVVD